MGSLAEPSPNVPSGQWFPGAEKLSHCFETEVRNLCGPQSLSGSVEVAAALGAITSNLRRIV